MNAEYPVTEVRCAEGTAPDAHCAPRAGWLEELLAELDQPNAGVVAPQISSLETPSVSTFGLRLCGKNFNVERLRAAIGPTRFRWWAAGAWSWEG